MAVCEALDGPVSDDRAAVTGIGHLVCRSLRTASATRTTAEVVHDERRPLARQLVTRYLHSQSNPILQA